jgi:hypothetical protein
MNREEELLTQRASNLSSEFFSSISSQLGRSIIARISTVSVHSASFLFGPHCHRLFSLPHFGLVG